MTENNPTSGQANAYSLRTCQVNEEFQFLLWSKLFFWMKLVEVRLN